MMKRTVLNFFFLLVTLFGIAVAQEQAGLRHHRGANGQLKRRLTDSSSSSKGGSSDASSKGGSGSGSSKGGSGSGSGSSKGGSSDSSSKGGSGSGSGKGVSRRHLENILA